MRYLFAEMPFLGGIDAEKVKYLYGRFRGQGSSWDLSELSFDEAKTLLDMLQKFREVDGVELKNAGLTGADAIADIVVSDLNKMVLN